MGDAIETPGAPFGPSSAPSGDPAFRGATWVGAQPAPSPPKTWLDQLRGGVRLALAALITLALLPPFFLTRALGARRDRFVIALWCGALLWTLGLRARAVGRPLTRGGVILANHSSWLDILVLGWLAPVHFVAKAEVEGWAGVGWIGRISNTVFIARKRTEAKAQERLLAARARGGDVLCLFPEGTSSDGRRVLPFKTSIFALFYAEADADAVDAPPGAVTPPGWSDPAGAAAPRRVLGQPTAVHYRPPVGLHPSFYGWWATMPLRPHIWDVVCLGGGGLVTAVFAPPFDPAELPDRKTFAAMAQARVAEDHAAVERGEIGP